MKCLFALLQLFLIFQIVLNSSLSSSNKNSAGVTQIMPDTLYMNQVLQTNSQLYFLAMQGDGNLVLYSKGSLSGRGNDFPLWSSNTQNKGLAPWSARITKEGFLTITDINGIQTYNSSKSPNALKTSQPPVGPYKLVMQEDGNLVIYDSSSPPQALFATGTNAKR